MIHSRAALLVKSALMNITVDSPSFVSRDSHNRDFSIRDIQGRPLFVSQLALIQGVATLSCGMSALFHERIALDRVRCPYPRQSHIPCVGTTLSKAYSPLFHARVALLRTASEAPVARILGGFALLRVKSCSDPYLSRSFVVRDAIIHNTVRDALRYLWSGGLPLRKEPRYPWQSCPCLAKSALFQCPWQMCPLCQGWTLSVEDLPFSIVSPS